MFSLGILPKSMRGSDQADISEFNLCLLSSVAFLPLEPPGTLSIRILQCIMHLSLLHTNYFHFINIYSVLVERLCLIIISGFVLFR